MTIHHPTLLTLILFTAALLGLPLALWSQTVISGKVVDESQQAVAGVSVSYKRVGSASILGFGRSDAKGLFQLNVKANGVDSLQLEFNHMSYRKKTVVVRNITANYTYTLQQEVRELEEVKVANIPVYKRKDTVNYSVSAFTSQQDHVIGDIIKKLPGIEMQGEQILYQGKPIQKYMVNNLDLMEGRHAMINRNLPVDAVRRVQVVENDQPIKILDSLVFSDRASLNLELKRFTSTGTGKVGAGLSPALWDVNLTPMTFGKTFQMLNSAQSNNVGHDVSRELRPFYTGGSFFRSDASRKDGPSYIHLRNVASPGFDENKWLDNKIFLFSSNMLQKLHSGLELKANVSYYDDTRQRQGITATQYFTAEEIIYNSEAIDNQYRANVLDAGLLVEKNEKQVYLRNRFNYHKRWNRDLGNLLFNQVDPIAQKRLYTDEALFNTLSVARLWGKQLVNINSTVEWHRTPQRLSVSPGQFVDIINQGNPYEQMTQRVLYDGLRWDNNLQFTQRVRHWTFSPLVALNYNRNALTSHIDLTEQGDARTLEQDYRNDVSNSQLNLNTRLRIGWENARWKINLNLPYDVYYFDVTQQGTPTLNNVLRNTFNPSAGLTYLMHAKHELSSSLSAGTQYGGLDNFYNGFIISHYRNMQRYDARLLRSENKAASVGYKYTNTLKANFAHISYRYSQGQRDYMFTTQIDHQGRTTTSIADRNSGNDQHNVSGGVSRLFSSIKTVVKLNGSLSWSTSDYLLNDLLSKRQTRNRSANLEVINNLTDFVSAEYRTNLGHTTSILAAGRRQNIMYNNHYLVMAVFPHVRHTINLSNALYRNNMPGQRDQYFLDVTYRFGIRKWKIGLEITANNLLNNQHYVQQFSNDIELIQSHFELRPRQIIVATRFKF